MRRFPVFAAWIVTTCCACTTSDGPDAREEAPATTTTTTTAQSAPLWASVVAEAEAGSAPARVGVIHDTSRFVTLSLSGAFFDKVPAGQPSDFQLAVSADIASQVRVGYCNTPESTEPCVVVDLASITGPHALVPTSSHTLWVHEAADGLWSLDIQTEVAEPFLALRIAAQGTGQRAAEVTTSAGVLSPVIPTAGGPGAYVGLPLDAALSAIAYTDAFGVVHAAALEAALDDAYAYTIVVGTSVEQDAVAVAELQPVAGSSTESSDARR